jgi:hypothetical protein
MGLVFELSEANHTVFIFGMHAFDAKAVDVLRFKGFLSAQKTALIYCHFIAHDIGHETVLCDGKKHR